MRIPVFVVLLFLVFSSCKDKVNESEKLASIEVGQQDYESFGERINTVNSLSAEEMKRKYLALEPGDTIAAKFTTTVNSVCKMKGCWMKLDLPGVEEDPMIKFKDYDFFVPKDIEGREVIVEGLAFIEETSVEDQKHFAKDAGKSPEDIEAIDKTERSMAFLAYGVLLKK